MSPAALLDHLRGLGVVLRADGDLLRFRPAEKVTPELRAQLLAAKPAVMALLSEPARTYASDPRICASCGRSGFTAMIATRGAHVCRRCWRETTKIPDCHQPATPGLDAAIARADALAERRDR